MGLQSSTKLLRIILITMVVASCSVSKKVPDGSHVLVKNEFEYTGKKKPLKSKVGAYVRPRPQSKILLILPPLKASLYNASPAKFDSTFMEYYEVDRYFRNQKLLDSLLIKHNLEKYVGRSLWLKRFLFNNGKPPPLIDEAEIDRSARKLEDLFFDEGYFDAQVTDSIYRWKKRGKAVYRINPGTPSFIQSFDYEIQDPELERIYFDHLDKNLLATGNRFRMADFEKEAGRIQSLYKNRGYFDFNADGQALYFDADSTTSAKALDITLRINNPTDSTRFRKYYWDRISIYDNLTPTDVNENPEDLNSLDFEGYTIYFKGSEPTHRQEFFTDALLIERNELYRQEDEVQSKRFLFRRENLNIGAATSTKQSTSDSLLDFTVYTTNKKKYDLTFSLDGSWSQYLNFGISPELSLLDRNIFKGGENLEVSFAGTIGTVDSGATDQDQFFNAFEFSAQAGLEMPYFWFPFINRGAIPKKFAPTTTATMGFGAQKNIGLGRVNYITNLNYSIAPRNVHQHQLFVFNNEYVRNFEADRYFDIFQGDAEIQQSIQELYFRQRPDIEVLYQQGNLSVNELTQLILIDEEFFNSDNSASFINLYSNFELMSFRRATVTQNSLINSLVYQYTFNQSQGKNPANPNFLQARIELAGNLMSVADNLFGFREEQNLDGTLSGTLFGVPYSQFFKLELDYRKYWQLNDSHTLAFRNYFGFIKPYGNSRFFVPFDRLFFAGGANDVRAWRPYALGPAGQQNFSGEDGKIAIDNLKLLWSLEYRFDLFSFFEGALFVDAGNIWSIDSQFEETVFEFSDFYEELGVGSGFGLRVDLTYLLLRFDLAYRLHDPALPRGDRWRFNDFNVLAPRLNFGINYPF